MRIDQLDPEQQPRFHIASMPELTGKLLRLSIGGAVVQYDRAREIEIEANEDTGRRGARFVSNGRPITISRATEVVPLNPTLELERSEVDQP